MEVLIDCYFDRLFSELERSELASRFKRRLLVKYFSDVINSCAEGENTKTKKQIKTNILIQIKNKVLIF